MCLQNVGSLDLETETKAHRAELLSWRPVSMCSVMVFRVTHWVTCWQLIKEFPGKHSENMVTLYWFWWWKGKSPGLELGKPQFWSSPAALTLPRWCRLWGQRPHSFYTSEWPSRRPVKGEASHVFVVGRCDKHSVDEHLTADGLWKERFELECGFPECVTCTTRRRGGFRCTRIDFYSFYIFKWILKI